MGGGLYELPVQDVGAGDADGRRVPVRPPAEGGEPAHFPCEPFALLLITLSSHTHCASGVCPMPGRQRTHDAQRAASGGRVPASGTTISAATAVATTVDASHRLATRAP